VAPVVEERLDDRDQRHANHECRDELTGQSHADAWFYLGPVRESTWIEMLPKTILVPTDLSDGAEEALDYACELARGFGATIHLLNVIGIPAHGVPELGVALTSSVIDSMVHDNQAALEKLLERKRHMATFGEPLLRTGDARD